MKDQELTLKVQNRDGVVFRGPVKNITSYNKKGVFDVLPKHQYFISIIQDYLKFRLLDGEERQIELGSGIMRVHENQVDVYLGVKQELAVRKSA